MHARARLPSIAVVVPVRDMEETVGACARALLAQRYPGDRRRILFVDNGSTDGTAAVLSAFPVDLVAEPAPGAAAARNRGVAVTDEEIVAFTDADCVPTTGWLHELAAGLTGDHDVAAGGLAVLDPAESPLATYAALVGQYHPERTVHHPRFPYAATGNMAIRRSSFERVGGFDPSFPTYEGADLAYRLRQRGGFSCTVRPRALVFYRPRRTTLALVRQNLAYGRDYSRFFFAHRGELDISEVRYPAIAQRWRRRCRSGHRALSRSETRFPAATLVLVHWLRESAQLVGALAYRPARSDRP